MANKFIREFMIHKYGKKCMMEEAGIRNIPKEKRNRIKGYKKIDEKLTYHHIIPKNQGGPETEENGAILKKYNHDWLEQQSKKDRDRINQELQKYKQMVIATINNKNIEGKVLEFDMSNTIDIPLINKQEKERDD